MATLDETLEEDSVPEEDAADSVLEEDAANSVLEEDAADLVPEEDAADLEEVTGLANDTDLEEDLARLEEDAAGLEEEEAGLKEEEDAVFWDLVTISTSLSESSYESSSKSS